MSSFWSRSQFYGRKHAVKECKSYFKSEFISSLTEPGDDYCKRVMSHCALELDTVWGNSVYMVCDWQINSKHATCKFCLVIIAASGKTRNSFVHLFQIISYKLNLSNQNMYLHTHIFTVINEDYGYVIVIWW